MADEKHIVPVDGVGHVAFPSYMDQQSIDAVLARHKSAPTPKSPTQAQVHTKSPHEYTFAKTTEASEHKRQEKEAHPADLPWLAQHVVSRPENWFDKNMPVATGMAQNIVGSVVGLHEIAEKLDKATGADREPPFGFQFKEIPAMKEFDEKVNKALEDFAHEGPSNRWEVRGQLLVSLAEFDLAEEGLEKFTEKAGEFIEKTGKVDKLQEFLDKSAIAKHANKMTKRTVGNALLAGAQTLMNNGGEVDEASKEFQTALRVGLALEGGGVVLAKFVGTPGEINAAEEGGQQGSQGESDAEKIAVKAGDDLQSKAEEKLENTEGYTSVPLGADPLHDVLMPSDVSPNELVDEAVGKAKKAKHISSHFELQADGDEDKKEDKILRPKVLMVPGIGRMVFPHSMSDEDIGKAIKYYKAHVHSISGHVPGIATEASEHQRQMGGAKDATPSWETVRQAVEKASTPTSTPQPTGKLSTGQSVGDINTRMANYTTNTFKTAGRALFGLADFAPQTVGIMKRLFSSDPEVSRQAEGDLLALHPGAQISDSTQQVIQDWKKDPQLAAADVTGSALALYLAGKAGLKGKVDPDAPPQSYFNMIYRDPETATKEEMSKAKADFDRIDKEIMRKAPPGTPGAPQGSPAWMAKGENRDWMMRNLPLVERIVKAARNLTETQNKGLGEIRKLPDGQKIVYMSRNGLRAVKAIMEGPNGDENVQASGVSIPKHDAEILLDRLRRINAASDHPIGKELTTLLSKGQNTDGQIVISNIPHGEKISETLAVMREELNHNWQFSLAEEESGEHLSLAHMNALNKAIPPKMNEFLEKNQYPKATATDRNAIRERVAEAGSKLMSEKPSAFGLTPDEAAKFLLQYFQAVYDEHGAEGFKKLIHTTPAARHLKEEFLRGAEKGKPNFTLPERGAGSRTVGRISAGRGDGDQKGSAAARRSTISDADKRKLDMMRRKKAS